MTKSTKSHIRERSPLLYISPCRLAATSANTLPRPSRYSLTTATGSNRSSADSDLLLCHVGLWRTSRFRFGCVSGCEHSKMWGISIIPSTHSPYSRPPTLLCGRADNACTNLLGYLVCCVRTRGSMRLRKARDYRISLCSLSHALATHYFLRLTRARGGCFLRGRKALLNDFWYFSSQKSTIKKKYLYISFRGRTMFAPTIKTKSRQKPKQKIYTLLLSQHCRDRSIFYPAQISSSSEAGSAASSASSSAASASSADLISAASVASSSRAASSAFFSSSA